MFHIVFAVSPYIRVRIENSVCKIFLLNGSLFILSCKMLPSQTFLHTANSIKQRFLFGYPEHLLHSDSFALT